MLTAHAQMLALRKKYKMTRIRYACLHQRSAKVMCRLTQRSVIPLAMIRKKNMSKTSLAIRNVWLALIFTLAMKMFLKELAKPHAIQDILK